MQYNNLSQPANTNSGALICHPTLKTEHGFNILRVLENLIIWG